MEKMCWYVNVNKKYVRFVGTRYYLLSLNGSILRRGRTIRDMKTDTTNHSNNQATTILFHHFVREQ